MGLPDEVRLWYVARSRPGIPNNLNQDPRLSSLAELALLHKETRP